MSSTPAEPSTGAIAHMTKPVGERYWNINMPRDSWTDKCPDYLISEDDNNIGTLSTLNDDYKKLSWEEVQHLININRIDKFYRVPTDLHRYRKYTFNLTRNYGSILSFIQNERLRWKNTAPSGDVPFSDPTDYKILYNDWPYGIHDDIVHLVVWTKFLIDEDGTTGDLTEEARELLEKFVVKTFCTSKDRLGGVDRNDLIWFKNWRSLKSVHALEHFHVMLYKASNEFCQKITNGDRPMCEQQD